MSDKTVHSTHSTLRLLALTPEVYAGYVSPESEFVIFFPDNETEEEAQRIINITGDQGQAKTSFLNMIKELAGGDSPANSVNSKLKKKSATLLFLDTQTNLKYEATLTTKTFTLKQLQERDGEVTKLNVGSPKESLRKLIGPLGINPMDLKKMKPAEQIAWVRSLFKLSKDQLELEQIITSGIKKANDTRKNINREMKRLRGGIVAAGFGVWKAKEKTFTQTPKFLDIKKQYEQDVADLQKEVKDQFDSATQERDTLNRLVQQKESEEGHIKAINNEIEKLQERIKQLQGQRTGIERNLENIEKSIEDRKDAEANFQAATARMNNMNKYVAEKQKIDAVAADFKKYDELEEEWKNQDAKLGEYQSKKKEFVKLFTPDIPGIEVCVPTQFDINEEIERFKDNNPDATEGELEAYIKGLEHDEREGLFYNGRSMYECSESEIFEVGMGFWKEMKVTMAFIENSSVLGTNAIETLNQLAANGCYIFVTTMVRKENFKIEFHKAIEA
jgi:DNA repair exonuclease SbcCD ATPase subunit